MLSLARHIQNSPGTAAAARTGLARGVDEGLQLLTSVALLESLRFFLFFRV